MPPKRKRNRTRRRVSLSSSSSSSSGEESDKKNTAPILLTQEQPHPQAPSSESSAESSDDDKPSLQQRASNPPQSTERPESLSPSPPPSTLPEPLPTQDNQDQSKLKDTFHKYWMSSVADAFQNDLEKLRKEPGMTADRLGLLIDSLASGAHVYASRTSVDTTDMELVVGQSSNLPTIQ